jgi:hypothetical protein
MFGASSRADVRKRCRMRLLRHTGRRSSRSYELRTAGVRNEFPFGRLPLLASASSAKTMESLWEK